MTTPEGVVVFDPLSAEVATLLLQQIKAVAPNPAIRYVIYSHHHADHVEGAKALGGSPVIVAHANTARDILSRPDEQIVPPSEVFDSKTHSVTLGGTTIELIHIPGAHTDGMVVSYLPAQRALVEVDMAMVKMVPPVGAPYSSFHGTIAAIEEMQKLDYDLVIPGHGAAGTKRDIADYLVLLRAMDQELRRAATAEGLTRFHGDSTFFSDPKVGAILFRAVDAPEPQYAGWQGFDHHMLQGLQWAFFYGVYMNE